MKLFNAEEQRVEAMERKAAERSSEKVWTCTTTHWLSSSVKYTGNFFLGDSFGTNDPWPSLHV